MTRSLISVGSGNRELTRLPVWTALAELVPVEFCFDRTAAHFKSSPLILIEPDDALLSEVAEAGQSAFVFASAEGARENVSGAVAFSGESVLDARIRGRTIRHEPLSNCRPITPEAGDAVLATYSGVPVWVGRQGMAIQFLGVPFPSFDSGQGAFDFLNGGRFIHLLPLLHFLRQVAGDGGWQPPVLRACMMFDDPNLHWSSYGFLPFRETTALAKRHNFHVACATVPLDSWYVHGPTAAFFRENGSRISLLIHGNDHLLQELGRSYEDEGEIRLLAQALQRIERLELRSGVRVSRVMAPPHGAFRPTMIHAMSRLGFDGACISPWSLRDWGQGRQWPSAFGLHAAEMIEQFPVVPRFRMHSECEGWIIINAFLNRPVIPVGHHDTLSDGLNLLVKLAGIVNSLPKVEWSNMEKILLSNYWARREDATLCIRPFAARARVTIPNDVRKLRIESEAGSFWRLSTEINEAGKTEFTVEGKTEVELRLDGWGKTNFRDVRPSRSSPWAPVRRGLCEIRDRVRPLLHRA
jgi:hypothetical protein